jgi:hypothetical protein
MFRRLFRSWFFWIVLILGVAALVAWCWHRPLQTVSLPSGSTLSLRKVTWGTRHAYHEPLSMEASLWETIRHALKPASYFETEEACAVLHLRFTLRPRRDIAPTPPEYIEIPLSAHHAFRHEAQSWFSTQRSGVFREAMDHGILTIRLGEEGYEDYFVCDPITDRRQRTLQLRFYLYGREETVTLRNPFYKRSWPTWTPAPFPVRMEHGDFTVAMRGWKYDEWGKPVPDLAVQYEDATGQRSSFPCLPRGESAWKVRVKVGSTDRRVIEAQKPVWLESMPPGLNQFRVLEIPPEMTRAGICYLALVDGGPFRFKVGADLAPTLRSSPPTDSVAPLNVDGSGDLMPLTVDTDELQLFAVERHPYTGKLYHSNIYSNTRPSFLQATQDRPRKKIDLTVTTIEGRQFAYRLYDQPLQDPPAGQPVRIRCHWPEVFEVEFTVAPPPDGPGQ